MCQDSTVSSVLETYTEDATEYNTEGKIVWAESSKSEIGKYINFLMDELNVDKHVFNWVESLCKYGDLYLELFKQSDYDLGEVFSKEEKEKFKSYKDKEKLNEDLKINAYAENDNYVHYIEAVPNPAEMFELTKFSKTVAYVKADLGVSISQNEGLVQNTFDYHFNKKDVELYPAGKYVHACLEDDNNRFPEKITLFKEENINNPNETKQITYKVRRGKSLFYNVFKIWRLLSLLENSLMLNRLTKSAILRIITVDVGDMPKDMVGPHLQGIKQLFEQKAAINVGKSIQEYTNPGPMENNVYVPKHGDIGTITTSEVGGDVEVGKLSDIDYFINKFFGAVRIPKQYFGLTDDGAGFNGGQSLAILSSRYAKMVKRIQSVMTQAITDVINLLLVDKGMTSYINEFSIKMQAPMTQEEVERRDNLSSGIGIIRDIMDLLTDIETPETKLKVLKSLLSNAITNSEVIDLIQNEITKIEQEEPQQEEEIVKETDTLSDEDSLQLDRDFGSTENISDRTPNLETEIENQTAQDSGEENELPSPEELDIDFTDNTIGEE